ALGRTRGEDLGPQDGRKELGPVLADLGIEKGRDQISIAERQLALDERLDELEVRLVPRDDLGRVRTSIDDLHVVNRYDREPMRLGVEIRPGLEVADDDLG